MVLSHMVFGRCVLNVIVSKMRKFRRESEVKAKTYQRGTMAWGRSSKTKALSETIRDEMLSPDIELKKLKP